MVISLGIILMEVVNTEFSRPKLRSMTQPTEGYSQNDFTVEPRDMDDDPKG